MQIRLDPDIADKIRREASAHRRIFKRRKSYAEIVNKALRDLFGKNGNNLTRNTP